MGYTKSCEGCSKTITWVYNQTRGQGYFAEPDNSDARHLCPRFDILKDENKHHHKSNDPVAHEQTLDVILRRVTKIENVVAEIKMKLDNQLQIDVRP